MEITPENADAYFAPGNHVEAEVWLKFAAAHRAGAIASARRAFERELRRAMREDETGTTHRDDFAVFEQALWMLLGSPWADASGGDALGSLTGDAPGQAASTRADGRRERWSPEALRWLGGDGAVTVRC